MKGVRCYDNGGETIDRYTAVYTRSYKLPEGTRVYGNCCMSENPTSPQGVGMHGESMGQPIDRPSSKHLGKRIPFEKLPERCQKLVLHDLKG